MKVITTLILFTSMSLAYAGDMIANRSIINIAQVSVNSEQEIIRLHELGFQIPDVKIRERIGPDGTKQYSQTKN